LPGIQRGFTPRRLCIPSGLHLGILIQAGHQPFQQARTLPLRQLEDFSLKGFKGSSHDDSWRVGRTAS
jgi:hypothetical protein